MAGVARALAHPARLQILHLLAKQTECRGADVFGELPLAQSTVSEHIRVLREAGLVNATPVGTRTVYCLVPGVLEAYLDAVQDVLSTCPSCQRG